MANPNDTSKPTRSRRNLLKAPAAASVAPPELLTLEEAIENERSMLLQIRSMLYCLCEVLLYADDDDSIMHAEVAQTAARLINDVCVRFDSVNIRPLMKALRERGGTEAEHDDARDLTHQAPHQVREARPLYLA